MHIDVYHYTCIPTVRRLNSWASLTMCSVAGLSGSNSLHGIQHVRYKTSAIHTCSCIDRCACACACACACVCVCVCVLCVRVPVWTGEV